ncbi:hypothetical protein Goarm_011061 [Gossypium armourianum]|uniref:Uncharacterized protein n=1 Tax=Gossypium armourianum TaxID=34283 RepID=A0A7J9IWL1_9ROSI|nr:hypothetical protein [Gossypium armourianum]
MLGMSYQIGLVGRKERHSNLLFGKL